MYYYYGLVNAILSAYPETQAVYRFGSWGTPDQNAESDLDVAVLLPHETAVDRDPGDWIALNGELAYVSRTDKVDLINLRTADTSLQAEILRTGEALHVGDDDARLAFEVYVLAKHQELNSWRRTIQEEMVSSGHTVAL